MSLLRDITIIKAQTKRISFCKNGWYSSFVFSSRDLQELYSTEAVLEETINHVVLLKHINLKPRIDALTVADFLDDEGVEADLVDALLQAIGHIDLLYLTMQGAHLRITQLRTQDLIIELFYTHTNTQQINVIMKILIKTHKIRAIHCAQLAWSLNNILQLQILKLVAREVYNKYLSGPLWWSILDLNTETYVVCACVR